MEKPLLRALHDRRVQIRSRWKTLLDIERIHTPLANPSTLVFLFDQTLDEILAALEKAPDSSAQPKPECCCECNPLRDYFTALEQALMEALILAQTKQRSLAPAAHSIAADELRSTLRRIARREIALYDTVCQQSERRSVKG